MKNLMTAQFVTRCFGAALIAGTMLAGHTFAAQPGDVPSQIVKFGDLNLNSTEGVATLYKRIHRAAEQLCPSSSETRLLASASSAQCVAQSEARAVKDVNNAALTGYYMVKTGGSKPAVLASNNTK